MQQDGTFRIEVQNQAREKAEIIDGSLRNVQNKLLETTKNSNDAFLTPEVSNINFQIQKSISETDELRRLLLKLSEIPGNIENTGQKLSADTNVTKE